MPSLWNLRLKKHYNFQHICHVSAQAYPSIMLQCCYGTAGISFTTIVAIPKHHCWLKDSFFNMGGLYVCGQLVLWLYFLCTAPSYNQKWDHNWDCKHPRDIIFGPLTPRDIPHLGANTMWQTFTLGSYMVQLTVCGMYPMVHLGGTSWKPPCTCPMVADSPWLIFYGPRIPLWGSFC